MIAKTNAYLKFVSNFPYSTLSTIFLGSYHYRVRSFLCSSFVVLFVCLFRIFEEREKKKFFCVKNSLFFVRFFFSTKLLPFYITSPPFLSSSKCSATTPTTTPTTTPKTTPTTTPTTVLLDFLFFFPCSEFAHLNVFISRNNQNQTFV